MDDGDAQTLFDRGIDLFNRQEFFECHEVFEELWTFSQQPDRWFLQALIHFAVGFYHAGRSNSTGATRQLRKGLRKIQGYLPQWDGVQTGKIAHEVEQRLREIEAGGAVASYPQIVMSSAWPGLRSPLRKCQGNE